MSVPRLSINVDHVATLRQARLGSAPDPVGAAVLAELAGADGITIHLREDRRHIQDRDVRVLRETVRTRLSLEMAATDEMVAIALEVGPDQITLVPEKREELTTEGGLDARTAPGLAEAVRRLEAAGLPTFLFLDPEPEQVEACARLGATGFELHTGTYAEAPDAASRAAELERLVAAAGQGRAAGLAVHAGHGLDPWNVGPVAAIEGLGELSIGHAIIGRAVLVGMERAVSEMRARIVEAVHLRKR